jgi:hypothetical protein
MRPIHNKLVRYRLYAQRDREDAEKSRQWVENVITTSVWKSSSDKIRPYSQTWLPLLEGKSKDHFSHLLYDAAAMGHHLDKWKTVLQTATPQPRSAAAKRILVVMVHHLAEMEDANLRAAEKTPERYLAKAARHKASFRALENLLRTGEFRKPELETQEEVEAMLQSSVA